MIPLKKLQFDLTERASLLKRDNQCLN